MTSYFLGVATFSGIQAAVVAGFRKLKQSLKTTADSEFKVDGVLILSNELLTAKTPRAPGPTGMFCVTELMTWCP